ncbi:hypothetical protein [Pedobacter punctiformis]|uniref:Uncharacterized protein n=1 Tax=Pedobacter punctiformis TaxID=3004097 RepID=A0ABT4L807_9SPHI|nr:hypothetical protein [Pedobacter sp. HCMS5-2]MCZ4244065.1 hypothetical protein [Pedobacter sp. HCMS5-2]
MKIKKKPGVQNLAFPSIRPITDCDYLIDLSSIENPFPNRDGIFSKNNQPKGEIKPLSKFFPRNGLYSLL